LGDLQNIAAANLLREYLKEKHLDTASIVIFRNGIFHWPVKENYRRSMGGA
jgi:hypothetical protein